MFDDLDATLKTILEDPGAPADLVAADVSFEVPDKSFAPAQPTVDLFLHEVKENRDLRDPVPIVRQVADQYLRRWPPLRVDCTYMVTTWSNKIGAARVVEEHRLLALSLLWLSRFRTIPAAFLQGSLALPESQPYPPPTLVAQMDGAMNSGEFWSALGTPPRPSFNVMVTISMDLVVESLEGPPVITSDLRLEQLPGPSIVQRMLTIGGRVVDGGTLAPIASAQVELLGTGRSTVADGEGRFRILGLEAGAFTLRASAPGFTTADKAIVVPAAALNGYDVSLSP